MRNLLGRFSFRSKLTALGVFATLAVLVAQAAGWLAPLERRLYDLRAQHCQRVRPTTAPFVHVYVDDTAIDALGKWPWPKRTMAKALDELHTAGASLVGLDIIYPDHDLREGGREDEAALERAIERWKGRIVLPVDFTWKARLDPVGDAILRALKEDPRASAADVAKVVVKQFEGAQRESAAKEVEERFIAIRRQAFLDRILESPSLASDAREQVRREVLGEVDPLMQYNSPLERLFERQYERSRAMQGMWRLFHARAPEGVNARLLASETELPPLENLAKHAAGYGFVNYSSDADGILRSVPMISRHRQLKSDVRISPQFSLALACAALGIDTGDKEQFKIEADRIVLKPADGPAREIPLFTNGTASGVDIGTSMLIPWSGPRDWQRMYGFGDSRKEVPLVSFMDVYQIVQWREDVARNRAKSLADLNNLRRLAKLPAIAAPADDHEDQIARTLEKLAFQIEELRKLPAAQLKDDEKLFLTSAGKLEQVARENRRFHHDIARHSATIADRVRGKVVIVGWSVTSAAVDFVPTSLHGKCPGAAIHGVIYNGIMTGHLWRPAPAWLNHLLTLLLGLMTTWAIVQTAPIETTGGKARKFFRVRIGPWKTTLIILALAILWLAINGWVLFDRNNYVVQAGGPLLAIGVAWALGTAATAAERFRIVQQLRGYVDRKLVDYLSRHPENQLFEPKKQLVTVCFSDIEGFTMLTQQLGERMIGVLQDYLSRMVPVIRDRRGLVNNFMGDGIMFSFGAPESSPTHAQDALECLLDMQDVLKAFNESHDGDDIPALRMRMGINTGEAFVGDAGPAEAREYTALGDTTNLAARLETANKVCGTTILVSQDTVDHVAPNLFFFRPIGRIKLRNRQGSVMVYELLSRAKDATDRDRALAKRLLAMIEAFMMRSFEACLALIGVIEAEFSLKEDKLLNLYRTRCNEYLAAGVPADFEGEILRQE